MKNGPNETDVLVGTRVRIRRVELGLSQTQLANALGVTFQQVQKYEKGTNRIGASRLHAIAGVLRVPVSYFFPAAGEGVDHGASTRRSPRPPRNSRRDGPSEKLRPDPRPLGARGDVRDGADACQGRPSRGQPTTAH